MDNLKLEELIKAEQSAYAREWRAKNKDKVKKHNANYWRNRVLKELQKEGKSNDTEERNTRLA